MKNIPEKCERCGAPIDWDNIANEVKCSFCGKTYLVKDNSLKVGALKVNNEVEKVIKKTKDHVEKIYKEASFNESRKRKKSSDQINNIRPNFNNKSIDWAKLKLPLVYVISVFCIGLFIETRPSNKNKLENSKEIINEKINDKKLKPATDKEINLYSQIGISNLCMSRQVGTDFPKAISVAAKNYQLIISSKHGGYIKELGDVKLPNKQIYNGAILQILDGAIKTCPEYVPEADKKRFAEALKKLDKN